MSESEEIFLEQISTVGIMVGVTILVGVAIALFWVAVKLLVVMQG